MGSIFTLIPFPETPQGEWGVLWRTLPYKKSCRLTRGQKLSFPLCYFTLESAFLFLEFK